MMVSLMNVRELREVSFCGGKGMQELSFRHDEFETSIWKCPAGNIKLELRQVVMAGDVDLGILQSVKRMKKCSPSKS